MIRAALAGVLVTLLGIAFLTFAYGGDVRRAIADWQNFAAFMLVAGATTVLAVMWVTRRRR